ncbi:phage protein [Secundilactobacillus oryzae JCM 18671]|uniref:Phage protein n=1 Tax=Secundilactobacillus oryzae JCM 18671 TaxID=1291743 RepID=A0A081BI31_9LACO|nr:baseplate J/gp47 family protein [Secundilactobacillus oryzae]GAK47699.1 phage protein [Secundilactobacillus oryzae JCM 18671]
MALSDYGLTENGFVLPEFDALLAEIKATVKNRMGSGTDVSDGSNMGKLAFVWADQLLEIYEHMQDVHDSAFKPFATGVSLDRLASNDGIQRILAQPAQATLLITGKPGYLVEENSEFMTDNGDSFFTAEDVQIDQDGKANVLAYSEDSASYANVDANTIINPANPVDEIEEVTNPEPAAGGVDLETDYDLRRRLLVVSDASEGPTPSGLITAITNVPGVTGVTLQENLENVVDRYGNPPLSLHFFVSGGVPGDIAQAIATNIAAGAITVGDQEHHVIVDGNDVEVHFDTAQVVKLSFKINLSQSEGYDEGAVNEAVSEFLDEFDMGQTIILNKLYSYLYGLDGVAEISNIQASLDGTNFSTNNISLERYQTAATTDDLIEVIVDE